MALKALECPQCGANLEMDNGREFGFCEYCGAKVQIKEVIEVRHKVDNTELLSNYKTLGERAYQVKNYLEALNYYSKAIELSPNDSACLFKHACSKAYSRNIKEINFSEFSNEINLAIKYATQDDFIRIENELIILHQKILKDFDLRKDLFETLSLCNLQVNYLVTFLTFTKGILSFITKDENKENVLLKTIEICDQNIYQKLYYFDTRKNKYINFQVSQEFIIKIQNFRNEFAEIYNNMPKRIKEINDAQNKYDKLSSELLVIDNQINELKKSKNIKVKNPARKKFLVIPEIIIYVIFLTGHGLLWAYLSNFTEYEDGRKPNFGEKMYFWTIFFLIGAIVMAFIVIALALARYGIFYAGKTYINEKCDADKVYNLKIQFSKVKEQQVRAYYDLERVKKKRK